MRNHKKFGAGLFLFALGLFFVPHLAADSVANAPQQAAQSQGLLAHIGSFLNMMRSHTIKNIMEWINFIILMGLFFKFIFPMLEKALESGVEDIETRLNAEELEKAKVEARIQELKSNLQGVEQEQDSILSTAKEQAEKMREEILTGAREAELKVFDDAERNAAMYYFEKVHEIKNVFFGSVVQKFEKDLSGSSKNKALKEHNSTLVKQVGGKS